MAGKEARGRFSASAKATHVEVQFVDGHTEDFSGEDAHSFALAVSGKTQPLSVYHLLEHHCRENGTSVLRLGGDRALSQAAHFGSATVDITLRRKLDDASGTAKAYGHLVPEYLNIRYEIVIRREADG